MNSQYYANLVALENKLGETLNNEGMVFTLKTDRYPITLTISPNASPAAQMGFFATNGDSSSTDALMQFIFNLNALEIRTDNRFVISDALMSKIKGQAKKIHHAFLEGFFAEHIRLLSKAATPVTAEPVYDAPAKDETDADEFDGFFGDPEPAEAEE